jgi:ribosomal protein S18 acetylase RimI-like enzyme
MPSVPSIRLGTPDDAAVLALLGHETFVETFGHLYPESDLLPFLAATYAPQTFHRCLADPLQAMWIAEHDGKAVGYAHAGPCTLPHPDVTPSCGELKRLYVHNSAQGHGLGNALLATALAWLTASARDLWIGVWSENLGAQRLYARHGFVKAGEYEFAVGATRDREFILRRRRAD